jgi:pimeloyl-ACP methyl ester carboxylesterase
MLKWLIIFFIVVILILIFVYNVINQNENKALYYPSNKCLWKPKHSYETVFMNVNDRKDICYSSKDRKKGEEYISGWHFNNFKGKKTVLFSHGTSGNISHRKYLINMCRKFKLNVLVFDYRGYGKSDGFPHKLFLREDGEIAYEYLHYVCKIPHEDIIIWTESLGCISGAHLCTKYTPGGLILFSGFSSLDDVVNYSFKGYKRSAAQSLSFLLSCKMDMLSVKDCISEIKCPIAIVHSKNDEIVPYECSKINYKRIRHKNKMFVTIRGGHSCPQIQTRQLRQIFNFCSLPDNLSSGTIKHVLKDVETFAQRHNNFID